MNKIIFVLLGLASLLLACRRYGEDPIEQERFREVRLGVMHEQGVSVDSVGMVSFEGAGSKQEELPELLYAVQVRFKDPNGGGYKPYCLGLYDDLSMMTFKLNTTYLYEVEVTAVADGKHVIATNLVSGLYMQPFTISGLSGSSPVNINEVMYSDKCYFNSLAIGSSHLASHNRLLFTRPSTDRFYGMISDIKVDDTDNNEPVAITLKRVVFGMKFCPVDFKKGDIMVQISGAPPLTLMPGHDPSIEYIYTFTNAPSDPLKWTTDNYNELVSVKIMYRLPDAQYETLYNKNLTITRRGLYVVNVNLGIYDDSPSELVSISCEGSDWTGSTTIDI